MFKSQLNNGRVENLNFLDLLLVDLAKIVVPLGHLDIQNVVSKVLDAFETVVELLLEDIQTLGVLFTALSAKLGHLTGRSTECELKLTFADLLKVSASLDESVNFSEDLLILLEVPVLSAGRVLF